MKTLKQKIQATYLFDPLEKIDMLVALDTYSDAQKTALEQVIDDYDRKYEHITKTMKQNVLMTLTKVEAKEKLANKPVRLEALKKIRNGLNQLVPDAISSPNQ